ncbi:MAG TPA: creatininase family protein [Gemmatimonadales bacterium]|nr:creatininase family protein [Gemmatimonadales bacterium]
MRPYVLSDLTWSDVAATRFDVAVLPWGATEAHNTHLPHGTDTISAESAALHAAERAWNRGAKVLVLPAVAYGVHTAQLDIPICVNVNPSTQRAVLEDIARSLVPHGVRKLVIVSGHGANEFRWMIRELLPTVPLFMCTLKWWEAAEADVFDQPGDHGGELETSTMLHLAPGLVRPLDQAGPGAERHWKIRALREGWAWAPRRWSQVTKDTGVGNPKRATREKGEKFFAQATENIGAFLVELAAADPADLYE